MFNGFFILTIALAVAEWVAVGADWQRIRWVTKPGTLLALIAWFTSVGHWTGPLAAIGLGLVCALLGDVLLMLPKRYFLSGMAAFALTQLFYIAGFNQLPLAFRWEAALPAIAVTGAFAAINRRLRYALPRRGGADLIVPIIVYAILLSLMWFSALTTLFRPGWLPLAAIMVSIGGGLFFLSDSVLAYHRFVRRLRYGDLIVMVTYHIAQILIAGGTLEQFLITVV